MSDHPTRSTKISLASLVVLLLACTVQKPALAQQSWEYSPYRLRVWVALEPSPRLTSADFARISDTVSRRGKVIGGSTWAVQTEVAPVGAASDILYYMDQLTDEQVIRADESAKDNTITLADKLYTVAVRDDRYRFQVLVRELDMHTRIWGRQLTAEVVQAEMVPDVIMNLIAKAFLPVMRIETIEDKDVVARNRAMGLIQGKIALTTLQQGGGDKSERQEIRLLGTAVGGAFNLSFNEQGPTVGIPFDASAADVQNALEGLDNIDAGDVVVTGHNGGPWTVDFVQQHENLNVEEMVASDGTLVKAASICEVPIGAVMQPVVRRNNRLGQPLKGGILVSPWTLCQVLGYEGINSKLRMHAGKSNPLGVRRGVRTRRYTIMIRPDGGPTELLLQSDIIDDHEPLVGYDFYEKDPMDLKVPAKHLGKSDWRGSFLVEPNGKDFRLVYVRSGGKLMARMPIVPGHHSKAIAFMRDDDRRLEAESYIRSVESEIMDQVVQRKLLERNIEKRLVAKKFTDAEEMIERFQELPKQTDMKDRMDTRQGEIADGPVDRRTIRLIDQMFSRAEKLISEHISPSTLFTLRLKLKEAQSGGGTPAPPSGGAAPKTSANGGGARGANTGD